MSVPTPEPSPETLRDLNTHFAATGQVASSWAALEYMIDQAIWKLAGIEEKSGACLTAQFSSIHSRMRALIALIELRGGNKGLIKEANIFSRDATPVALNRNRIVHSPLILNTDMSEVQRINIHADKSLLFEVKNSDIEHAKKTVNATGDLMIQFGALRQNIEDALLPSDDKSPPPA